MGQPFRIMGTYGGGYGTGLTMPEHRRGDVFILLRRSYSGTPGNQSGWSNLSSVNRLMLSYVFAVTDNGISSPTTGPYCWVVIHLRGVRAIGEVYASTDTYSTIDWSARTYDYPFVHTRSIRFAARKGLTELDIDLSGSGFPQIIHQEDDEGAGATQQIAVFGGERVTSAPSSLNSGVTISEAAKGEIELICEGEYPYPTMYYYPEITTATNSSSINVAMPLRLKAGMLLMASVASGETVDISTPSGWTKLSSGASRNAVFIKKANGDEEGTTVNFSVSSGTPDFTASAIAITNWTGDLADVEIASASSGGSTTPNPPSLTPSWGATPTLWLWSFGTDSNSASTLTAIAGWSYWQYTLTGGTTSDQVIAAAGLRWDSVASTDPASSTLDASEDWVAHTIAVKGGAFPPDNNLFGSFP
jgi:hypothetical protein